MTRRATSGLGAVLLGMLAGMSAWISLGTLALIEAGSRTRVGALPSIWLLVALAIAGGVIARVSRLPLSAAWPLSLTLLLWLPWLPVRVPSTFLLWVGPLEALVWAVVVLGVLVSWPAPWWRRLDTWLGTSRLAIPLVVILGLAGSIAGATAVAEQVPGGDEPHYVVIAQSLLLDGDLRVENNHARGDYLAYYPFDLRRPDFQRRGQDGTIHSIHMPGVSVLILPAFALAGYTGAWVWLAFVSAVGGAFAWHAAWLLTRDSVAACVGWIGVTLSAPVFFHAFTIYPDAAGATLSMIAVWLLVRMETESAPIRHGWLALAGAGLASLPWLHSRFAIVAGGLGAAIVLRLLRRADRWRACASFLVAPVVAAVGWFAHYWIVYGTLDPAAPYHGFSQNRLATLGSGLPGILADQQFGLIANAPVFGVALAGFALMTRVRPRLVAELVMVGVPYVLTVASFDMWWGGHSAPARFLLVLLWPGVIGVAWVWSMRPSVAWRAMLIGTVVVGISLVVARAAVEDGALLYNARDGYDLLLDWASRTVNLPLAFPSFHRDAVGVALGDSAIWLASIVVAMSALALSAPRATGDGGRPRGRRLLAGTEVAGGDGGPSGGRRSSTGARWALGGGVCAATIMAATALVLLRHGVSALTPPTSQLSFLESWSPTRQPIAFQLRPTRPLPASQVPQELALSTSRRRPPASTQAPLEIPRVPAGRYELMIDGAARLAGQVHAVVGRTELHVERWDLDGLRGGATGVLLDLPVDVHSVTIDGDTVARTRLTGVRLRPRAARVTSDRLVTGFARRATRYGEVRAFFLDDNAFMEAPGFWTRGDASTKVVIDDDRAGPRQVRVRNGPVDNRLAITLGDWRQALMLAPNEVREFDLPSSEARTPRLVRIQTATGFRPADVDRSNGDFRLLGVWFEFP